MHKWGEGAEVKRSASDREVADLVPAMCRSVLRQEAKPPTAPGGYRLTPVTVKPFGPSRKVIKP